MKQVKLWMELQPMTYEYLNKEIDTFGHEYPVEIPTTPLLFTLIIVTIRDNSCDDNRYHKVVERKTRDERSKRVGKISSSGGLYKIQTN